MDAASSDEDVSAALQISREMDDWASVGRRLRGLESRDFEAKVGESGCALALELVVRRRELWEEFPWHGEAFSKH